MPPASAFGGMYTHPSPMSRGLGCFVSFLMGRTCVQTAASPRAGTCRLRRLGRQGDGGHGGPAVPAASSLRRVGHASPPHEQGADLLRFVSVPAVERIHGGRPTSRGRPPAAVFGTGDGGNRRRSPKRDPQGSGPLSGCGQSPPCSPRDGCVDSVASWSAGRHASVFPARLPAIPDGQTAPQTALPRDTPKIRRANSEVLLPVGQTASIPHTCSISLPRGARMRHFPPPVQSFLPRKSARENASAALLHMLPPQPPRRVFVRGIAGQGKKSV